MACEGNCYRIKKSHVNEALDRALSTGTGRQRVLALLEAGTSMFDILRKVGVSRDSCEYVQNKFYAKGDPGSEKTSPYWKDIDHCEEIRKEALKFAIGFDKKIYTYWVTMPRRPEDRYKVDFKVQVTEEPDHVVVHLITPQPDHGTDPGSGRLNYPEPSWLFGREATIKAQQNAYDVVQPGIEAPIEGTDDADVLKIQLLAYDPQMTIR
ncbi:MAG: hypothetical protein O7G84_13230 [Gammaproteobacteria bacterium]|nr:hypothetical protein [Gammaproteobacteria bacterium]